MNSLFLNNHTFALFDNLHRRVLHLLKAKGWSNCQYVSRKIQVLIREKGEGL